MSRNLITLALTLAITGMVLGIFVWCLFALFNGQPLVTSSDNASPQNQNEEAPTPSPVYAKIDNFDRVPRVPLGSFRYGGSTTFATIREVVDQAIQTAKPGFNLRYTDPPAGSNETPGSSTGIRMLLKGQLDFSQSSRSLKPDEEQQGLKQIPVAIDGIAIAVNPSLNIPGLTIDQLKGIYSGQITNWKQVGGSDLPVIPYSRRIQDGGTVEFLVKNFLQLQELGFNVKFAQDTTEGLRQVASNPGGIYYGSAPEIVPQCTIKPLPIGYRSNELIPPFKPPLVTPSDCPTYRNQLNAEAFRNRKYPIIRELFVIVTKNNQIQQQAGEAYANLLLTIQGQELIEKAGFVKIR